MSSIIYIVVPCYNEEAVLHETSSRLAEKMHSLMQAGKISPLSRVMFVNDGSKDRTWEIIEELVAGDTLFQGVKLSRNKGHQNALLAGLMTAKDHCDAAISMDADLQDDINAVDEMIEKFDGGCDIVYGVRSERKTDTFFKKFTAQGYYKLLAMMGVDIVYNHADYRLMSRRALQNLESFGEVNLFLRGLVPLVGYRCSSVYYERAERIAGESHYPLKKMLAFAFDGITSLSNKPIRLITGAGIVVSLISFIGVIWAIVQAILGSSVAGWASIVCIVCFMGGVQLVCLGVIGEYIGKIYMETKARPRYIISERTWAPYERKYHG